MKAAVSILEAVFAEEDRLAKQLTRRAVSSYSRALREFLARHAPDQVTDAVNCDCDEVEGADDFGRRAARRVLAKSEW